MTDWADEKAEEIINNILRAGPRTRLAAELTAAHLRLAASRGAMEAGEVIAKAMGVQTTTKV